MTDPWEIAFFVLLWAFFATEIISHWQFRKLSEICRQAIAAIKNDGGEK